MGISIISHIAGGLVQFVDLNGLIRHLAPLGFCPVRIQYTALKLENQRAPLFAAILPKDGF